MKVYLASPYSKGDQGRNVHDSLRVADYLSNFGVHVKCPLLTHFWNMMFPHPYEFWLDYDLIELSECDVLVRMEGDSNGADGEVYFAEKRNMPVHYFKGFDFESLSALDEFINKMKTVYE